MSLLKRLSCLIWGHSWSRWVNVGRLWGEPGYQERLCLECPASESRSVGEEPPAPPEEGRERGVGA